MIGHESLLKRTEKGRHSITREDISRENWEEIEGMVEP
jgi:hypothetical protein